MKHLRILLAAVSLTLAFGASAQFSGSSAVSQSSTTTASASATCDGLMWIQASFLYNLDGDGEFRDKAFYSLKYTGMSVFNDCRFGAGLDVGATANFGIAREHGDMLLAHVAVVGAYFVDQNRTFFPTLPLGVALLGGDEYDGSKHTSDPYEFKTHVAFYLAPQLNFRIDRCVLTLGVDFYIRSNTASLLRVGIGYTI